MSRVTLARMQEDLSRLAAAKAGDQSAFGELVAGYRRELRAYCYRMTGSLHDADDLLQESLLRAWRGLPSFEGRSSFRTWLYRVTFTACVDATQNRPARMLAIDCRGPAAPHDPLPAPEPDRWIDPCPASMLQDSESSPEARYGQKESVALAFLAALQLLPPRQRAMLLACDVLGWTAPECAEMFDSTVASVHSAVQRARETLEARAERWRPTLPSPETTRALLERYVQAWESADVELLAKLLHEDATLSMPPLPMWLRGVRAIAESIGAMVLVPEARGQLRLLQTEANGLPAFAAYRRAPDHGFDPMALHLLSLSEDRVMTITAFLDPSLFARFELPARI